MAGRRGVSEIVPNCTTNFGTDTYNIELTCTTVVGAWYATVAANCSNTDYTTQVDCETVFGWWSVATPGSCSDPLYTSEYGCDGAGTCSDPTYSFEYTCVAAGTCSDPVYNDNEITCIDSGGSCSDGTSTTSGECFETPGTCTDGTSTNKTDCTASSSVWTPTNTWTAVNTYTNAGNAWTSAGNVWTPGDAGYCSDGIQATQEVCEGPRGTWILEDFEHCTTSIAGITVDNQVDCESPRGTWDSTILAEIDGEWVEIVGDGIDLTYTITLGGVEQTNQESLNLPYKVRFEIHPDTPLGEQELRVTNADMDTSAFADPFVVSDTLYITTVNGDMSPTYSASGSGFAVDTIVEILDTGTANVVEVYGTAIFTDANNIDFVMTYSTSGIYDVRVTNLDGQTFTEIGAITIP
jgi:hypothetical protein